MRKKADGGPEVARFDVVTIGARDYYQVAIALHEAGLLGHFITDFYTPTRLQGRVAKRWVPALPARVTRSFWPWAWLSLKIDASTPSRARKVLVDDMFGFVAGMRNYFGSRNAIVYSYFLHGFVSFYRMIGKRPNKLVCFQVHPTPWFINRVIHDDVDRFSAIRNVRFQEDYEEGFGDKEIAEYRAALSWCDKVICASDVTRRSVVEGPTETGSFAIVPYGSKLLPHATADLSRFWSKPGAIRLLTVCQLTQRKGMHWAFEAMRSLPLEVRARFEWVVVANRRDAAIAELAPDNVSFHRGLSDEELSALMASASLFVMPSLIEGFGLVYVEALSVGTPIVWTENTGPADMCRDGVHGHQVKAGSLEDLVALFGRIAAAPQALADMRPACAEIARSLSWEAFRRGIVDAVRELRP